MVVRVFLEPFFFSLHLNSMFPWVPAMDSRCLLETAFLGPLVVGRTSGPSKAAHGASVVSQCLAPAATPKAPTPLLSPAASGGHLTFLTVCEVFLSPLCTLSQCNRSISCFVLPLSHHSLARGDLSLFLHSRPLFLLCCYPH